MTWWPKLTSWPVHQSCQGCQAVKDVNYVIKEGNYAGLSALTFAYRRGQEFFIKRLEEKGAQVNSNTIFGYCANNNKPDDIKCNPRKTNFGK